MSLAVVGRQGLFVGADLWHVSGALQSCCVLVVQHDAERDAVGGGEADGSELAGASPTGFTLERADVGAVGSTFSGGML